MELLLDAEGRVNYDIINVNTTVKEVLAAIDVFLDTNPLPCNKCEESCCKKSWSVEVDNICVNRFSNWNDQEALNFVQDRLIRKKNYYRDFNQYVLKKKTNCNFVTESNLCTIYDKRPIICRLYICSPKSYRYNLLRELIGSTYLRALVLEDAMRRLQLTERTVRKYKRNPAVFAEDYDIALADIFNYAEGEGWLDTGERAELYSEIRL